MAQNSVSDPVLQVSEPIVRVKGVGLSLRYHLVRSNGWHILARDGTIFQNNCVIEKQLQFVVIFRILVYCKSKANTGMGILQSEIIVLNISIHALSRVEFPKLEINIREESLVRISMIT